MSLEAGVDGETACSGVHAGHVLNVVDLLLSEFCPIIPVVIVKVLGVNKWTWYDNSEEKE